MRMLYHRRTSSGIRCRGQNSPIIVVSPGLSGALKQQFSQVNQRDLGRPVLAGKIKRFALTPNHPHLPLWSHPGRGAYRDRHERGVRCGGRGWHQVRCKARGRMEPPADGEVVWFWHPDADAKSANTIRGRRWQESPVTGKSTKETVKTIAQGRPDCLGEPVVTKLVCFLFCTRGCGCGEHPAFPAPSFCWRA
jgi:hypothetical protein